MRILSELRFRLRALFNRSAVERDLDDELRSHIEYETEKLVRAGVPAAEAERRARASFGGMDRIKEDARDARGISLIEETSQDLRHALRALRTRKVFAFGVIATLALGIGANATMFGIIDRVLFRPPHAMRDASHVHRLYRNTVSDGEARVDRHFAFATLTDLQKSTTRSFSDIAGFQSRQLAVGDGDAAREVTVTLVSGSFFGFFDAVPLSGRFIGAADDGAPEGAPVVVLGHGYWQTQFGGADVVGKPLRVDRTMRTIIGVAPPSFVGMADQGAPALYIPLTSYAFSMRGGRYTPIYTWSWIELIARRKPDVTVAAAQADLAAGFVASWRNAYNAAPQWGTPEESKVDAQLAPVQLSRGPHAGRDARVTTWIGGVALVVLLIACANVANLLLSRAVSRRREVAMRVALGASRGRLVRQVLTETLVLAALGGAAGLAIAQWGAAGLRAWFLPADLPAAVLADPRTLLFAAAATIATALLTGLAPALQASRADISTSLKAGGRNGAPGRSRLRTSLLVFQAALSVVLLVGAGLFVRSLVNVKGYRLGYDPGQLLFATANTRGSALSAPEMLALNDRLMAATKSVPGVKNATLAASVPFWSNEGRGLIVPGVDSVRNLGRFVLQAGSPEYFATMGTRITRGRAFDASDRAGGERVVVVSEGMARVVWPGQEALGKCIKLNADTAPCITVIGIAEEARVRSLVDVREFAYYLPAAQYDAPMDPQIFVRVDGKAEDFVTAVRRRLQAEMPGAAIANVWPLATLVDPSMRSWEFGAVMFVAFGALALVLAAIGLYSLIAYDVAQRTRDLSIRIALGAQVRRVMGMVLTRAVLLIAAGVVVGGGFALWAAPFVEALMFNQSPRDPLVFAAVAVTLILVSLVATAGPALRASRADPSATLRNE